MPAESLGSMAASVKRWLRGERLDDLDLYDAINDAIESLWESLILAAMQIMLAGPVTVSFNAGDERATVTTIADPAVAPTVTDASDVSALPAVTYYISYTYVTESGSETLPSPQTIWARGLNKLAEVKIPVTSVVGAIGWNLYAGLGINRLIRQNDQPIPLWTGVDGPTQQSFVEPATGFRDNSDDAPLTPTENTTGDNIFYIRHLEFKTTSGMYKSYNAGDLDSEFMRRMATYIAATSEYQSYAWDLINQRQLEIRPAVGAAFNPRYFYVVKPRRARFPNTPLPFPTVPSTEFIRDYSLSLLFLSLHEYDAAASWEAKSDKALIKAVRAVSQMNANRNDRVTAYMY